MVDARLARKLGATPGKLALIAGLAVALVAVLLFPVIDSSTPAALSERRANAAKPPHPPRPPRTPTPTPHALTMSDQATPPADGPPLPEPRVEETDSHDPFVLAPVLADLLAAPPSPLGDPAGSHGVQAGQDPRVNQSLAALRDRGVRMVLVSENERLAIVGDRSVRIGDMLDGLRVTSITAHGIALSADAPTQE